MCRECFPGPATQPAPPLPHVRGFPALRVLPAGPTSTVVFIFLRICPFGRYTRPTTNRSETAVDLPVALTLPFRPMPCSQTPPEFRTTIALAVAYYCLPDIRPCRPPDVSRGSIASLA